MATSLEPLVVRLDPQNAYYRDSATSVWAVSKSGGTPRLLSAANGTEGFANLDLDVNAGVVWWMWTDNTSAPKGLFRSAADGSGFAAVDTSGDLNWFGPRVDATAVYYIHAGALLKRLK